jgi:hypothetical protein
MVVQIARLVGEPDRLKLRPIAGSATMLWSPDDTLSQDGVSMPIDALGPARGIAIGLMLVTPFWGAVICVAMRLLH